MIRQDQASHSPLALTVTVSTAVLLVSTLALVSSELMGLLTRDTAAVQDGEWWRTLTPTLVQPSGVPALLFLLVGFVLLVPAVSRETGGGAASFGMVAGAIGGLALSTWLFPEQTGGGSSGAVAALVGIWAICLTGRDRHDLLSHLASAYAGFFASYLLFVVSPLATLAPLIGNAGAVLAFFLHKCGHTRIVSTSILASGAGMAIMLDEHGFGIGLGALTGVAYGYARVSRPGRATIATQIGEAILMSAAIWTMWDVAYGVPLEVSQGSGVRDIGLLSTAAVTGAAVGIAAVLSCLTLRGAHARRVTIARATRRRAAILRWLFASIGVASCAGPLWLATTPSATAGLISLHLAATIFAITLTTGTGSSDRAAETGRRHREQSAPAAIG